MDGNYVAELYKNAWIIQGRIKMKMRMEIRLKINLF